MKPGSSSSIPPSTRKGRPAAVVMATKFFWALGYNQVESFLTTFDPKHMEFDPKATIRRPNGKTDAVHSRRSRTNSSRRRSKTGRHLSRGCRAPAAGQGPRQLPL